MHKETMPDPAAYAGTKLWDEVLKAIVSTMPSQLFPLFKEAYGREYPKDTPIVVLGSETSSFWENSKEPPSSTLMDIALLVAGTDYYHLECQMKNDSEMVVRMFAYDVRFALTHSRVIDESTGEITLYFPHSVVIYPEKNSAIPDHLKCRIIFQDGSEHIYKIPTVKIQTYSLKEIQEKHLTLFIPYTILRLRPKLRAEHPLTKEGLTEFVEEVILVLNKELAAGYLTEREYHSYMRLFRFAADRVLARHPQMQEEVRQMTEPLIKLFSAEEEELWARIEKHKAEIANNKAEIEGQKAEIEGQRAEIADQKAEIEGQKAEIEGQRAEIEGQKAEIEGQKAEIADQKAQIEGQKAEIADQKAQIEGQKAEIEGQRAEIEGQKAQIADQKRQLAIQGAEIQRLQELVSQLSAGDNGS